MSGTLIACFLIAVHLASALGAVYILRTVKFTESAALEDVLGPLVCCLVLFLAACLGSVNLLDALGRLPEHIPRAVNLAMAAPGSLLTIAAAVEWTQRRRRRQQPA